MSPEKTPPRLPKTTHLFEIKIMKSLWYYLRVVHPQAFEYSIRDEIGLGIFAIAKISLRRQRQLKASARRKYKWMDKLFLEELDYSITIKLSRRTLMRDGNKGLPNYAIVAINKYLYEKMMTHLSRQIDELHGKGMEFREAIAFVIENYGLSEDEVKFETLKKRNYRYRLANAKLTTRTNPT